MGDRTLTCHTMCAVPQQLVEEVGDLAVVEDDNAGHVADCPQAANHGLDRALRDQWCEQAVNHGLDTTHWDQW